MVLLGEEQSPSPSLRRAFNLPVSSALLKEAFVDQPTECQAHDVSILDFRRIGLFPQLLEIEPATAG